MSLDRRRPAVQAGLLAWLAATLLLLPLVVTFDDLFAAWASWLGLDRPLAAIAPLETALAAALLQVVGTHVEAQGNRLLLGGVGLPQVLIVSWNCTGWQTFLLLGASLAVGLRREQPLLARLEVACLGLLGTLLCNVARVALVALLAARFGYVSAVLFHDYGGVLLGVAWLFLFWEAAYRWVLLEKPSRMAST